MSFRLKLYGLGLFFMIFGAALPARGYVLPGPQLLLLMTQNLGSAVSLVVHQHDLVYGESGSIPRTDLSETLTYRFPTVYRSESTAPDYRRIHVGDLDDAVTIMDGKVSIQKESIFDRYVDLLLYRSRIILQERLSKCGINPMVSSLGRMDGVPIYVLGAQYPDQSVAQVWIQKRTFRPLRLLIPVSDGNGGNAILEFRYLAWQKHKKLWYPMQIECYQNDRLLRKIVVDDVVVDAPVSDDLFDMNLLRAQYGTALGKKEPPPAATSPSEIQKALEDFQRRYEQ